MSFQTCRRPTRTKANSHILRPDSLLRLWRYKSLIYLLACLLTYLLKFAGARAWNDLPVDVTSAPSLHNFRK